MNRFFIVGWKIGTSPIKTLTVEILEGMPKKDILSVIENKIHQEYLVRRYREVGLYEFSVEIVYLLEL